MAQNRGRQPARRNYSNRGNGGMPGWAWLVIGVLLATLLFLVVPRFLAKEDGGFFKPKPNPDAQPVASSADEAEMTPDAQQANAKPEPAKDSADPNYAFYDMLPGDEVKLTDAQLAAMARAEQQKAEAAARTAASADAATDPALPTPIDTAARADSAASTAAAAPTAAPAVAAPKPASVPEKPKTTTVAKAESPVSATVPTSAATPYILQAGAFGQANQADELKAKVALLGLNARVEQATVNGKTMYRVRMGPYATAGELAAAKTKLGNGGLSAIPIKAK